MMRQFLPVLHYVDVEQTEVQPVSDDPSHLDLPWYAVYHCDRYIGLVDRNELGRYLPW